jgi:ParB-like chromosome segregation protein Spo0J
MRVTMRIPVSNITYGRGLPLHPKVLYFALLILRNRPFPPITVFRNESGAYVLKGGRNRLAAHKLLGRKLITANVGISQQPNPEKIITSNISGVPLSAEERASRWRAATAGTAHPDL